MRYSFHSRVFLIFAALPAVALGIAQPARAQFAADPVAQTRDLKLDPLDTAKSYTWQPEPNGPGELLPAPVAPQVQSISWGAQIFAGTAQGLLYANAPAGGDAAAKPQWSMLPALYGHPVRPIGDQHGMLVVQDGEPFTDSAKGLVLLDDGLKAAGGQPDIKGFCLQVDQDGFWMLDDMQTTPVTAKGPTALVHYDAAGHELQRFKTDGKDLPAGEIFWASGGANALWLAVFNFKGLDATGAAQWTDREMVRFDPVTLKAEPVDINAPGGAAFVNLPDKIMWLEPPEAGKDTWVAQSLDKTTLAIATVGDIPLPDLPAGVTAVNDMTSRDNFVWVRPVPTAPPIVVALPGLNIVSLATAGPWPGYQAGTYTLYASNTTHAYGTSAGMNLVAADSKRAWLLTSDGDLLCIGDDGATRGYAFAAALGNKPVFTSSASINGTLYLMTSTSDLVKIDSAIGSAQVVSYPKAHLAPFFTASQSCLWLTNYRTVTAVAPGAPDKSTLVYRDTGMPPTLWPKQLVAYDSDLYFMQWDDDARSEVLWRADGSMARRFAVASWLKYFAGVGHRDAWQKRLFGYLCTPDRKILFLQPFSESAKITIYDTAFDTWREVAENKDIATATTGPKMVIGFGRDSAPYQWKDDQWQPLALPTQGLQPIGQVINTDKYLYVPTALGVYRLAWEKIAG